MTDYASLIPINVLTGFLGSGKTTLLTRLLESPELPDTAVLVNEFGEVGLDHHLVQHVAESTLLLDNGCLCCAIRGDLQQSLRELFSQRERGDIPRFQRVVIEASGLADPAPIAYTLLAEPVIQHHFRLANVITVVDAVNGLRQLQEFPEAVKQTALADRLALSKTDLCEAHQVATLRLALSKLNSSAPIAASGDFDAKSLLLEDVYDSAARLREVGRWLQPANDSGSGAQATHDHADGVTSFCVRFDEPLDWTAFGIWMTLLLHRHGEHVLRIKGMLNVLDVTAPVLINAVQHIVHPPTHLEAWPDQDHSSRIVFIVRNIASERIKASLHAFNALANPLSVTDRAAG